MAILVPALGPDLQMQSASYAIVDRFLPAELAAVHPALGAWIPPERIEANIRGELECALGLAGEHASAARVVQLSGAISQHSVIARAHRKSGPGGAGPDGAAFIAVDHQTVAIETPAHIATIAEAVREAFELDALEMRLRRRADAPLDIGSVQGARPGKRLFAAPLRLIRQAPLPAHYADVRAQIATDLAFYGSYAALYAQMHSERPDLAPEIPVETHEDMQVYLEQGLLYHLLIEGRRAGVMAARRDLYAGMHGYRILEKFLHAEFRGRGLAAAAQRRFAEALDPSDDRILFGFIHPRNVWSIRAALHDGRIDVGSDVFVPLRPPP